MQIFMSCDWSCDRILVVCNQSDDGLNGRLRFKRACAAFASRHVAAVSLGPRPLHVILEVVDRVQVALLQVKYETYWSETMSSLLLSYIC